MWSKVRALRIQAPFSTAVILAEKILRDGRIVGSLKLRSGVAGPRDGWLTCRERLLPVLSVKNKVH
jgi:hypothetical protein